jgi:hypothetical protein
LAKDSVAAEELDDHRLAYLDYQGPISGDRGIVSRVDGGSYGTVLDTNDDFEVELRGCLCQGKITLHRTSEKAWMLNAGPQT